MRKALLELLKIEKGVTLLSFELIGAEPLLDETELKSNVDLETKKMADTAIVYSAAQESDEQRDYDLGTNLYRHGIKITLSGSYFDLRDYLLQLEQLSWKFFWQEFDLKVTEHPMNELSIEIYSLGSKEAFVGV
jgi:MSHA biogenesis protein MshJ